MHYVCEVIVLTWNGLEHTKRFVESFSSRTETPCRLIIIDNASQDGTREYLSALKNTGKHSLITVFNDENKGFVRGVNQGLDLLEGAPYICLVNNDVVFTKGWLKEIISVFESDERIGLLNPNSNNLGKPLPQGMDLDAFGASLRQSGESRFLEMPFCIGFCLVVRRHVLEEVGGLSEEFAPAFFEDTDYSLRVQRAGYLIGMARKTYVWHREHASFDALAEDKREAVFARSREVFLNKWGKALRMAWALDSSSAVSRTLEQMVNFARRGNFVSGFVKGACMDPSKLFREKKMPEHAGVRFTGSMNVFSLFWKILKKKKKFDVLIVPPQRVKLLNRLKFIHRAEVVALHDEEELEKAYGKRKWAGQASSSGSPGLSPELREGFVSSETTTKKRDDG